jgi:hypothetical protein
MEKYHFTKITNNNMDMDYHLVIWTGDADGLKKSYTINISFLIWVLDSG